MTLFARPAFEQALTHLIEQARAGVEGVGLLSAPLDGRVRLAAPAALTNLVIDRWTPLGNVAEFPRVRYEVDPSELLAAYNDLEADGYRPLVMVHAHLRGGAVPSPTDVRYATNPALLHLIVDLEATRPAPMLWRLHPDRPSHQQAKIRFQVVDLHEQKNQATDLTRGVTGA